MAIVELSEETLHEWLEVLSMLPDTVPPALAKRVESMTVALADWMGQGGSAGIGGEASPAVAPGSRKLSPPDDAPQDPLGSATGPMTEELAFGLRQVAEWRANGTWALMEDLANLAKSLHDSLSPALAERMTAFGVEVVGALDQLMSAGLLETAVRLADVGADSLAHAQADHRQLTAVRLWREIQDPDVQVGIKTLLHVLRRVPDVLGG